MVLPLKQGAQRFVHYFAHRYLPRWTVLLIDMAIVPVSYFLAFLLRFNFDVSLAFASMRVEHLAVILPVFLCFFWKTKSYSGILRHSTSRDIVLILASTIGSGLLLCITLMIERSIHHFLLNMPLSVVIILVMLVTIFMVALRLIVKTAYHQIRENREDTTHIVIFGAGELGQITRNTLMADKKLNIKIEGFIDDNTSLHKKHISGIPVYSAEEAFGRIIPEKDVKELIFAIDSAQISHRRKREVADECIRLRLEVKEIPPVKSWINGHLQSQSIRRIRIEDLLGRDAIELDRQQIEAGLKTSVVLVTGAAGSIGSEIVRQLIAFRVKKVILLDKAESDLYDVQQEILSQHAHTNFEAIVADVTHEQVMRSVFEAYRPDIVFNAAAYKHVPLMEKFPREAVRVNVGGTKKLADLSVEYGVDKFVFVSTDKAVNPSSVMGATKRLGGIYIQSLAQEENVKTRFITTRFGNVLGSNGSVVPLFKKQIEMGGPVTVTHKEITRYFMTIPEACQLVLEAGFMGQGGEIFVFDMGEPVRIYDLAEKMITLSGYEPGRDIEIKVTGLRPGEKLYEELLDNREAMLPTHNDKIMIARVRKHDYNTVNRRITRLLDQVDGMNNEQIVSEIIQLVPEFLPENPSYRKLRRTKVNLTVEASS